MARLSRFLLHAFGAGVALVPCLVVGQGIPAGSELAAIREQNRLLQQQVQQQQKQIDDLRSRLDTMQGAGSASARPIATRSTAGAVRISAEAGFAYFSSA